jgi:hypothetical protein
MSKKKLEDRISRLERALPSQPNRTHPYWEAFDRRVRISKLYMAWRQGEIEKPELADPRDLERWQHMESVWRIAKKIVARRAEAEGQDAQADEWYLDE